LLYNIYKNTDKQREGELEYTLSGRSHHISVLREMEVEPLVQALYTRMAQAEAAEVMRVQHHTTYLLSTLMCIDMVRPEVFIMVYVYY
jgi:hypothetical protein